MIVSTFLYASADTSNKSILSDKTALFVGDSITYGWDNAGGEHGGWVTRIAKLCGMKCVNAGVQGARISHTRFDKEPIVKQLSSSSGDYDMIVMHGGVNDARADIPMGKMIEEGDTDYRIRSFGGGLEDLFSTAKTLYPDAELFYITNFHLEGDQAKQGYTADMGEYFALAEQICEKWDVTVIDLYNNTALNEKLECTTTKYLYDMLHPNAAGYDIITPYILNEIEAYYNSLESSKETESAEETYPMTDTVETKDIEKTDEEETTNTAEPPLKSGCKSVASHIGTFAVLTVAAGAVFKKKRNH